MIDLHTHILPGVDDGATDLDMALAMARDAAAKGVTAIAATPHFYELPQWPLVKQKVEELRSEFNNAQIGVELVAGAELMMDLGIMEMDAGEIPTYGDQGKFCLIEFPMRQIPMYAEEVLFDLQTKGIVPIIAHPERYGAIVENPNLALAWLRQGCLIQMNSGSILGRFGSKIQDTAKIMLNCNMVQLVASDGHGSERRRLNLPEAYAALVDIVGQVKARELVEGNPRSILDGDFQPKDEPVEYRKRRRFFFSRFA
ncbi:MAG: tyrosine protein phosphatase [Bacillota bacterium]|jgi:protein-tyrosine phosphatase|nr:tyrosine protein phosphatase [Bacillota bacterium]NLJ03821.1 tyrosine protein phosphatase [Bacillota bacterium]